MNEFLKDTLPKLGLVKTDLQQHSDEKLLPKKHCPLENPPSPQWKLTQLEITPLKIKLPSANCFTASYIKLPSKTVLRHTIKPLVSTI